MGEDNEGTDWIEDSDREEDGDGDEDGKVCRVTCSPTPAGVGEGITVGEDSSVEVLPLSPSVSLSLALSL